MSLVRYERLDLADLASVAEFGTRLIKWERPIDMLVNNAGTRATGRRRVSKDGFELQLAANFLGHFALTAQLMTLLRKSRHPRVVQISSPCHRHGRIDFEDLQLERRYDAWSAYCQSKLALLIFAIELQRRSDSNAWGLLSVAAHSGRARTDRQWPVPRPKSLIQKLHGTVGQILGHSARDAAMPGLFAATAPSVVRGGFYGPRGPLEFAIAPGLSDVGKIARDAGEGRKLWEAAERLTRVSWPER